VSERSGGMTFKDWSDSRGLQGVEAMRHPTIGEHEAWDAATKAERERCEAVIRSMSVTHDFTCPTPSELIDEIRKDVEL